LRRGTVVTRGNSSDKREGSIVMRGDYNRAVRGGGAELMTIVTLVTRGGDWRLEGEGSK
jgi:hypothetical protein